MQYQVPQFIETEDRIIGGVLTLRQFLIIAAGAGVSFLFYFIFDLTGWIFVTILVGAGVLFVAFIKVNGRPITIIARAAFNYYWNPRFYLWRSKKAEPPKMPVVKTPSIQKHEGHFEFHFKKAPQAPPTLETSEVEEAEISASLPPVIKSAESEIPTGKITEATAPKSHLPAQEKQTSAEPAMPSSMRQMLLGNKLTGSVHEEKPDGKEAREELSKFKKISAPPIRVPETPPARPAIKLPSFFRKKEVPVPAINALPPEPAPADGRAAPESPSVITPTQEDTASAPTTLSKEVRAARHDEIRTELPSAPKAAVAANVNYGEERPVPQEEPRKNADGLGLATHSSVKSLRDYLARAGQVQNLLDKINTTKNSLPKRERSGIFASGLRGEKFELLRRATGEIEKARRIDYK